MDEFHNICEDPLAQLSFLKLLLYNSHFLIFQQLLLQDIDYTFIKKESNPRWISLQARKAMRRAKQLNFENHISDFAKKLFLEYLMLTVQINIHHFYFKVF